MILRLTIALVFLSVGLSIAQEKDTTSTKLLDTKIAKELIQAVTRKPRGEMNRKNIKSEDVFQKYQGKIIRRIHIRRTGFEYSIYDTAKSIRNTVTKIANALHSDTRQQVIRDNLFFRENRQLNPYLLADNERYLRDLDFILDSKIRVLPVQGSNDSVDVEVLTRDVFSLGVRGKARGIDEFSIGIYDANLLGMGQRVQAEFLVEKDRSPVLGKGLIYTKSSLAGSLMNLSAGYTELNTARSIGEENEYAYFLRLDRPLVSPYSRMAGGMEFSKNWSVNVYNSPDSLFRNYRYDAQDFWVGYNIGIKSNMDDRSRHFFALRYYNQNFDRQPLQEFQRGKRIYNDRQFFLSELTFYNQNFYKTSYVYGFGRTEDVPYGQTVNLTAGWAEDLGLQRIYVGSYGIKRIVRPSGRFYDLEAGIGSFFNKEKSEDGVVYMRASYFSKLYDVKKSKIRHLFAAGYARAFNNRVSDLLMLNNELRGFSPDSLYGFQRVYLRNETTVFTPYQFIGFRFAPFISLEGAYLEKKAQADVDHKFYWGASGGFRIRNENLIFGTVEFRAFFYPVNVPGVDKVSVKVTTNLRLKYSGSFVRPPDFLRYN